MKMIAATKLIVIAIVLLVRVAFVLIKTMVIVEVMDASAVTFIYNREGSSYMCQIITPACRQMVSSLQYNCKDLCGIKITIKTI